MSDEDVITGWFWHTEKMAQYRNEGEVEITLLYAGAYRPGDNEWLALSTRYGYVFFTTPSTDRMRVQIAAFQAFGKYGDINDGKQRAVHPRAPRSDPGR